MTKLAVVSLIAFSIAVAGCDQVPLSNPAPASEVDRLSDVDLPAPNDTADAIAAAVAIAAAPADPGAPSDIGAAGAGLLSALFGGDTPRADAPRTGPDKRLIPFGQTVAYGEIATVCDAPKNRLGRMVADVGGFQVYDSIPNSTAMRPHYVTGFDDNCVRTFSAALVLTGDVGTHEVVRYLPSNRVAFNSTDNAYEALKASYCRVGHRKPCGAKLDALAAETTFITAYETFGSRPRWAEILLHNGAVKAIDFKSK